jgi:hypothetical protein
MWKKILSYGVVGLLAVALVAGTVYILQRPAEVQAGQGPLGRQGQTEAGYQSGGGRAEAVATGDGFGLEHPADTWIPVSGTVVATDDGLTIETAEGEMALETGPTWYWDENGIGLEAGDDVVLYGFYEGDDFEIGGIENLTSGETVRLRDDTGRPLWAGRGRWGR